MGQEIDFEEWFDYFMEHTREMGYRGPVDQHTFLMEYESGKDYYEAAKEFVEEMNG